ncbi:MAG: prepilin-type N-terminal cleavage/methylation domain-containing protein [Verrucomicrobiota bacterium]
MKPELKFNQGESPRRRGFTLPELLVTSALTAAFITGAVLVYQNVTSGQRHLSDYSDVTLPTGVLAQLYEGQTGDTLTAYWAPNYGRATRADSLRNQFYADIEDAAAVYCLARVGTATLRPTMIPLVDSALGTNLDSSEAFRSHLESEVTGATGIFKSYTGASTDTSGSIFVLGRSVAIDELNVLAVYEIDLVQATAPTGTLASVRRYNGSSLNGYYDIFYSEKAPGDFGTLFAEFQKELRLAVSETTLDKFKKAKDRPFYLVWWPDPAVSELTVVPKRNEHTKTNRKSCKHGGESAMC